MARGFVTERPRGTRMGPSRLTSPWQVIARASGRKSSTSRPIEDRRAGRLTPIGAIVIAASMLAVVGAWADYDIFWHLANGRLMVEDGVFPSRDQFSWSAAGTEVISHSAQIDRFYYVVWKLGGDRGIAWFAALTFGLAMLPFALLIGRLRLHPVVEAGGLMLMSFALLPYHGARPHLVAAALFGAIVYLLDRPFGSRRGIAVGLLLGLWATMHGSFHVGFGVVGIAAIVWAWDRDARAMRWAVLSLLVGSILSVLTPYGVRLWIVPLTIAVHPLHLTINQDWSGLRPFALEYAGMGLLLLAALAVGVVGSSSPRSLAAIAIALAAIHLARLTVFAAPLLAVVVLVRLVERTTRLTLDPGHPMFAVATARKTGLASWAVLLLAAAGIGLLPSTGSSGAAMAPLPNEAVDRLVECAESGAVWNDFNWGGYLIWRGDGAFTVGIDGRGIGGDDDTLYPTARFIDYLVVAQGRHGWEEIVQMSPASYALVPADGVLSDAGLAGWRRVFQDDVAALFVREGSAWNCGRGECE